MRKLKSVDGVRNEGPGPAEVWDGDYKEPDLLEEGYVRYYEFMHGYTDKLIIDVEAEKARWEAIKAGTVEPTIDEELLLILQEEIQKEINKDIIRTINDNVTK